MSWKATGLLFYVLAHDGVAGLSVRASPAPGSVGLSLWLTGEGAVAAVARKKADTKPALAAPVAASKANWLRLTRRGATFTAEYSGNAKQWKTIAKLDGVPMSPRSRRGIRRVVGLEGSRGNGGSSIA